MITIILTTLLISSIIQYLSKTNTAVLYCGIFGFIGDLSYFSWDKFNILGILNDSRGGDACGIAMGKDVYHFNDRENKLYYDMIAKMVMPKIDDNIPFIFGHTRKTSANALHTGAINYTQPYKIYDSKKNLLGIGVHNGTLYNTDELKEKFGIPDKVIYENDKGVFESHKPNDSQTLLYYLLTTGDTSILEEYVGSAALVWHSFKDNKTYLYHGKSEYGYSKETEERPLYLYRIWNPDYNYDGGPNGALWFSSIEQSLEVISDEENPEIYNLEYNKVYKFDGNMFTMVAAVNRKHGQILPVRTYYESNIDSYRYSRNFEESYNYNKTLREILSVVKFINGRYYYDNELMHGIYKIDDYGYVLSTNAKPCSSYLNCHFINGILLNDYSAYVKVTSSKKPIPEAYSFAEIKRLAKYSKFPIPFGDIRSPLSINYYTVDNKGNPIKFSGTIKPDFTDYSYIIKAGVVLSGYYTCSEDSSVSSQLMLPLGETRTNQSSSDKKIEDSANLITSETTSKDTLKDIQLDCDRDCNFANKELDSTEEAIINSDLEASLYKIASDIRREKDNIYYSLYEYVGKHKALRITLEKLDEILDDVESIELN